MLSSYCPSVFDPKVDMEKGKPKAARMYLSVAPVRQQGSVCERAEHSYECKSCAHAAVSQYGYTYAVFALFCPSE
jgi:hypothetical protein